MTPPNVLVDAIALVVGHDQEHVGRALGRHDRRRPARFGIGGGVLDHTAEFRIGRRELFAVDGGGGAGRTGRAGGLDLRFCEGATAIMAAANIVLARMYWFSFIFAPSLVCLAFLFFVSLVKSRAASCADGPRVSRAGLYCAAFVTACFASSRSLSSATPRGSSLIVSLSSLPVKRNGGW